MSGREGVRLRGAARQAVAVLGGMGAVAGTVLDRLARFWVAGTFLAVQVHDVMMAGAMSPMAAVHAAWPVLLAAGLATRPSAVVLLLWLSAGVLGPWMAGSGTAALQGLLLVRPLLLGGGPLSPDWFLLQGAESVAVPGAALVARGLRWVRPHAGAASLLVLRVGLAAVLLAEGGGARAGAVPLLLAGLLVAGLGTRVAALGVLAWTARDMGGWMPVASWALAAGLVAAHGAGAWSLDGVLVRWVRRQGAREAQAALPHVVVVGGGFAGVAVARGLRHAACRVTLIDRSNHHLFQPLLYQVATAGLSPADIATPIRALFRGQENVRVRLARVTGVDCAGQRVLLDDGETGYDHLVLATGARHGYFGRDDWAPFAPGLKTLEDATRIRGRLLQAFESAEAAGAGEARDAWLTFVVVGGGPTGVELAGAIAELARFGMADEFRDIDPARARVVLVQAGGRLLPAFPPGLSADAARALEALGVEVRLDSRVEAVDAEGVVVGGTRLAARTVLWAAGVMASPAAAWLGVVADRSGRVTVGPDLVAVGCPGVLVVGDTAASTGWAGREVPGLAPAAKQAGAYAARVIRARLEGARAPAPFRYRHAGSLATIGRQSAVADFGVLRVRGALAWWLWGAAHIAFLVGGRNRAVVLLQWLWAYLTHRRGTRLITGGDAG